MNDDVVLGIPRPVRATIYLSAVAGSAALTPVAIVTSGVAQAVITGLVGACGALTGALAWAATKPR